VSDVKKSKNAVPVDTTTSSAREQDGRPVTGEVITFDLSRKLINVLGEDHYPYAEFLYHELAANAYDADATEVQIIEKAVRSAAPGRQAEYDIVVRDDGVGMDEVGLQEWFRLGDSSKPTRKVSERFSRPLIGQIGVGKVSILKAARKWTIETERHIGREEPIRLRVEVDVDEWVSGRSEGFVVERLEPEGRAGTRLTLHRVTTRLRQDRIVRHVQRLPLGDDFKVWRNGDHIPPKHWYGIDCVSIDQSIEWTEGGRKHTGRVHGEIWTRPQQKPRDAAYIEEPKTENDSLNRDAAGLEVRVNGDVITREFFGHATHGHSVNRIWGWVDADFLPILGNRTDYLRDHPAGIAFQEAIQPLFTAAYNKVRYEKDNRAKGRREVTPEAKPETPPVVTEQQSTVTGQGSVRGEIAVPEATSVSVASGPDNLAVRYGEVLNAILEDKPELSFVVTSAVVPSPGRPAKDRMYPARPTGATKPFLAEVTGPDLALIKSNELATVEQPAKGRFTADSDPEAEFADEMRELEIKAITPAGIRLRFIGLGHFEAPYRWNLVDPVELSLDINTDHALYREVEKSGPAMHRLLSAWIISMALAERRRPKVGASFAEDVETVCYELFTRLSKRR
jgi:hypothetical protein